MISESDILNCFQHLVEDKIDSLVLVGSGDDAAVIKSQKANLVHSLDISKIHTHFPNNASPEDIAFRSVAVALSDLAAMGATPSFISVGLTSNKKDINWYKKFTQGIQSVMNEYQIKLVGGDVTFGEINVCVNVFGYINENILTRSNAKPGDNIYITGQLGRGRKGLIDWSNGKKSSFVQHYFCPKINFDKSKYISELASSCIDISDGLLKDLRSICKLSKVGAKIFYEDIPITNDIDDLSYGDDYELCFTCPKIYKEKFNKKDFFLIGEITQGKNIELIKDNIPVDLKKNGWDSFE